MIRGCRGSVCSSRLRSSETFSMRKLPHAADYLDDVPEIIGTPAAV